MKMKVFLSLIIGFIALFSCEDETQKQKKNCKPSMDSPLELEYDILNGTCLDEGYIGVNNQFRIRSEIEYESIFNEFECDEFPHIDFDHKELWGSVFLFTGTNEAKDEISIFKEGNVIEVLHCVSIIPSDEELISDVQTFLTKWILVDKISSNDSVVFTVKRN